ncbi:lytic transglycosylase domain-containing protein [Aeromonas veronii]|uniref:lytic transglycosylase domain-containing protein n=1 Tax=Aeromonas veronii TaxID=654 RepID=UPI001C5B1CA6|nr:lytic transglycosylase domain-containing protein [Aeromonas veronii]MBW3779563.1 lytic transglycosylase domain-containing protein [Aeromonas veronii]
MLTNAAFLALAMQCAPNVHPTTMHALVRVESSLNPYAIGVVGGALKKQPINLKQGLAAVQALAKSGKNFSIGLGQINRQHFDIARAEEIFDPCNNLKLSSKILQGCFNSALADSAGQQEALKKAFSCYYSGNFSRGFRPENGRSYVDLILAANADVPVPAINEEDIPRNMPSSPVLPRPEFESWDVLRAYPRFDAPKRHAIPPASSEPDEKKSPVNNSTETLKGKLS